MNFIFQKKRHSDTWNRLPKAVAIAPSLLEFQKHLDYTLRHGVWILDGAVWSREFDLVVLMVPSNLGHPMTPSK